MNTSETQLYTLWRTQRRLRIRLVLVLVVILCLGLWLKPHLFSAQASQPTTSTSSETSLTKGTPDFKTFLPSGKTIDSYGGWTRVSPSESAPVYAYSDNLFGTAIIVSQQQLPDDFIDDVEHKVQKLQSDQGYVTQHKITVEDLTVYIGVSEKNYQSTIFVRDGVLILITSYRSISDTTISEYIQTLQ